MTPFLCPRADGMTLFSGDMWTKAHLNSSLGERPCLSGTRSRELWSVLALKWCPVHERRDAELRGWRPIGLKG